MQTATRLLFNAYVGKLAELNGLDQSLTVIPGELKQFAVAPAIEQRLQAKLQLTSDFMSRINVVPVAAQQGDRVGVGVGRSLAGRTNTAGGNRRNPTDPSASDKIDQYFCKKTDYDYAWGYTLLDAWAHRPEFQQLVRDAVLVQKAEDVITIGFNGTSAAAATDREANPLLQDVNWGWLYKMRENARARVMSHGTKDNAKVYVDAEGYVTGTADYANLDALVFDAIGNLIHERYRTATDLVVIVGADLVQEKYFKIISAAGDKATEQVARDVILPLARHGLMAAWLLAFLLYAREYSTGIFLMGQGNEVMGTMLVSLWNGGNIDIASSLAVVNTLVIAGGIALALRLGVRLDA